MDWKSIITGIVVGAILGIGSTIFILNGKISELQGSINELKSKNIMKDEVIVKKELESKKNPSWPSSPNGKYRGVPIKIGNSKHYQIKEVGSDGTLMTTKAEFESDNEVKAGLFSPDSKQIAAAYHYSNGGGYTWVGIWEIESGNLINTKRKAGWITDLYWVFNDDD